MLKNQINSKKQGDVGMGVAIGWFAMMGHTVCIPLTDSQEYDLVVENNGKLEKVQVKTTSCMNKHGNYRVELRVKGGNKSGTGKTKKFDCREVDSLFVVTQDNVKYYIPTENIDGESGITLGKRYEKYIVL